MFHLELFVSVTLYTHRRACYGPCSAFIEGEECVIVFLLSRQILRLHSYRRVTPFYSRTSPAPPAPQGKYIVPKYPKPAIAGDWVLMWENTGAVFRIRLTEDGQFESVDGLGSGQLGGRWNTWNADRCGEMLSGRPRDWMIVGLLRETKSNAFRNVCFFYERLVHLMLWAMIYSKAGVSIHR